MSITALIQERHDAMLEELKTLAEKGAQMTTEDDRLAGELAPRVEELGHVLDLIKARNLDGAEDMTAALLWLLATGSANTEEMNTEDFLTADILDRVLERNDLDRAQLDHLTEIVRQQREGRK